MRRAVTARTRQTLEAEVVAFVKAEVPPPRPPHIGPDTELERDLRMIWEDAEDLLLRFFTRFGIDHAGFELARYVYVPCPWFSRQGRRPPVKPLTLRMLVDAAEAGRWADQA